MSHAFRPLLLPRLLSPPRRHHHRARRHRRPHPPSSTSSTSSASISSNGVDSTDRDFEDHRLVTCPAPPPLIDVAVTEAWGKERGTPTVVNTWGEMNASRCVLASSMDDRPSNPVQSSILFYSRQSYAAQTKFETELRRFVQEKQLQKVIHFVNKTMKVAPYLAAIDVLVQNSQARGECFGRITIEAMAFKLPVLGTAAGGTMEIVVNRTTGLLHNAGKDGVLPLARNIVKLATNVEMRTTMGKKGYERVKEMFLEHHMSHRIAYVLREVLQHAKVHSRTTK